MSTDAKPESPKAVHPRMLWSTEKLLLPLVFMALGVVVTNWVNSKKPHLVYSIGEVIEFTGDKNEFSLLTVAVKNDGSKEAEDVQCVIDLGGCIVQDLKAVPSNLKPVKEFRNGDSEAHITIPILNPSEELAVTIKAEQVEGIDVSVRSKGAIGVQQVPIQTKSSGEIIGMLIIFAIFFIFCGVLVVETHQKKKEASNPKKVMRFFRDDAASRVLDGKSAQAVYELINAATARISIEERTYSLARKTKLADGTLDFIFLEVQA